MIRAVDAGRFRDGVEAVTLQILHAIAPVFVHIQQREAVGDVTHAAWLHAPHFIHADSDPLNYRLTARNLPDLFADWPQLPMIRALPLPDGTNHEGRNLAVSALEQVRAPPSMMRLHANGRKRRLLSQPIKPAHYFGRLIASVREDSRNRHGRDLASGRPQRGGGRLEHRGKA